MPSLAADAAAVEFGSQTPWPDTCTVYQLYRDDETLLAEQAKCVAVKVYLHMCGIKFQTEYRHNATHISPSGSLPLIKVGSFLVSEFEPIVDFITKREKGIGLDSSSALDEVERSDLKAYMSLVDNVLGHAESYMDWCDPEVSEQVSKPRYGAAYTWPLNAILPWQQQRAEKRRLSALGWLKPLADICVDVQTCCNALAEKLDGKEFFFRIPTELDALVYGHLSTLMRTDLLANQHFDPIVNRCPRLVTFCRNMEEKYFTETLTEAAITGPNVEETYFIGTPIEVVLTDTNMEETYLTDRGRQSTEISDTDIQ